MGFPFEAGASGIILVHITSLSYEHFFLQLISLSLLLEAQNHVPLSLIDSKMTLEFCFKVTDVDLLLVALTYEPLAQLPTTIRLSTVM